MSRWKTEPPKGQVFALTWVDGEYSVAQWNPAKWWWEYEDGLANKPEGVYWTELPRLPTGENSLCVDEFYALESGSGKNECPHCGGAV